MKNVIGIDPGNSGALVLLGKEVFEFSLMPLKQDGKSSIVDYRGLEKVLQRSPQRFLDESTWYF